MSMPTIVAVAQILYALTWGYATWFFWPSLVCRLLGRGHQPYDVFSAWDAAAGLGLVAFSVRWLVFPGATAHMGNTEVAVWLALYAYMAIIALGKVNAARAYLRIMRRGR